MCRCDSEDELAAAQYNRDMLTLVGTPIGNLEDSSIRAVRVLLTASIIACEDTRRAGLLLSELEKRYAQSLGISSREQRELIRYDQVTEHKRAPELVLRLERGDDVVLISDAGMPGIADPGYLLVHACRMRGIAVTVVPGPNAALTAAAISGLHTDHTEILGYPPEQSGKRQKQLQALKDRGEILSSTIAYYCAPHKLQSLLEDIQTVFGVDFPVTIARELTKVHEEVVNDTVANLLTQISDIGRGELVVLLEIK